MTASTAEAKRVGLYRDMLRIRLFEDGILELFQEGLVPGTVHQYQGQEAVAVGVCADLHPEDVITSTHRSHGHAIARGLSLKEIAAELWGKAEGCCHGKGGSMHLGNCELGMLPAIAIVGGAIPIAGGLALSQQMLGNGRVTVCFFGDGAVNEGAFHEAVNLASVWHLPVVLICENNQYAASTPFDMTSPVPQVALRAPAYGLPALTVDGMDVEAVKAAASEAVDRARSGGGPTLIECDTFRYCGHSRSDRNKYRSPEEEECWRLRDPIVLQRSRLVEAGLLSNEAAAEIEAHIRAEIEEAITAAQVGAHPWPEELFTDALAPGIEGRPDQWPGEEGLEVAP